MKPTQFSSTVLFLLAVGACDPLGPSGGHAGEYTATVTSHPSCDYCVVGTQEVLTATAYDPEGRPVAGVPIQFTVTGGTASLSDRTVKTDATGSASTTLTFSAAGPVEIAPHRPGSPASAPTILARWIFARPPTLRFRTDSLSLDRPGCTTTTRDLVELSLSGEPVPAAARPWINPQFVVTDTAVASSPLWWFDRRELWIRVRGPGRALLTISLGGVSDTLVLTAPPVEVVDVAAIPPFLMFGVGDTLRLAPAAYTACDEPGLRPVPGISPTVENQSHEVISLDPASGELIGRSVGVGSIVVRHGDLARTESIRVSDWRLSPSDTTIAVGQSLEYRTSVRTPGDAVYHSGWPARYSSSDTTVAIVDPVSGVTRGVRPGVARITAVLTGNHGQETWIRRMVMLRVEAR